MLPPNCCHPAALNVATQLLPPSRAKCCLATVATQLLPPSRTKCCQPNVASHDATTTRRRRRDDAEAATAWASRCTPQVPSPSLQVPSALTVAAAPKRPRSRCSLGGHSPQALPVSWAPCSPSSRCSPLTPHSVAQPPGAPQSLHPSGPSQSPGPHSRCSLVGTLQPKASLLPFTPDPRGWVRIAVRIEAGSDDDEGTTTGAGGVSRGGEVSGEDRGGEG